MENLTENGEGSNAAPNGTSDSKTYRATSGSLSKYGVVLAASAGILNCESQEYTDSASTTSGPQPTPLLSKPLKVTPRALMSTLPRFATNVET